MRKLLLLVTLCTLLAGLSGVATADVALPADLTAIGDAAFLNDTSLTGSLMLPEGVTTIGAQAFSGCTGIAGELVLPEGLTTIGAHAFSGCTGFEGDLFLPEGVTTIGAQAFEGCTGFEGLLFLPESIEAIGSRAFAGCTGLTGTLYIDQDVTLAADAFEGSGLTAVIITPVRCFSYTNTGTAILITGYTGGSQYPDVIIPPFIEDLPVMTIQASAFSGCTGIESVSLPASVSYVGASAFNRCTSLARVNLNEGLMHLDVNAFSGCSALTEVMLPASLNTVGGNPFPACTSLTTIALAEGNTAFQVVDGLLLSAQGVLHTYPQGLGKAELTLPAGTVAIDGFAFTNVADLSTVVLPDTLVSIESMAFSGCSALTTMFVPPTVTDIQQNAFMSCPNLTLTVEADSAAEAFAIRYSIPYKTLATPASAFQYTNTGSAIMISGLADTTVTELVIPSTIEGLPVVMIQPMAFKGASITSAVIPSGVTYIGQNAFQNCTSLVSVTLPATFQHLDKDAFSGCSALTSIHLPASLSSTSGNPFTTCNALTTITIAEGNTKFYVQDGMLFAAGGKLLCYPNGLTAAEVTLPSGTVCIGNSAFVNNSNLTTIVLPDTVTTIELQAFLCCMNLKSVVIPRSVTSIAANAVQVCPNLTLLVRAGSAAHNWAQNNSVRFELIATPASALKYTNTGSAIMISGLNDTTLTELVIPATIEGLPVVMIQPNSFRGAAFTSAVIPEGVTYIGQGAFMNCTRLESVTFPPTLQHLDKDSFSGCTSLPCVILPASLKTVSGNPFATCNAMDGIILDTANTAFRVVDDMLITADGKLICYPNGLEPTEVTLPEDVICIGNGAFTNNSALETIVLPSSVTAIEMQAFLCCPNLQSVVIPSSVTTIANSAVVVCPNMVWTVDAGSAAETYAKNNNIAYVTTTPPATDASAFTYETGDNGITITGVSISDASVTDLVIPASIGGTPVTAISANFGLWNASSIRTLVIPGSIEAIPANFLQWGSDLTSVIFLEGVKSIGDSAFMGSSIPSFTLPESLTTIGANAFSQCGNLTSLTVPAGVTTIGQGAMVFTWGTSQLVLTVTEGSAAHTYCQSNNLAFVLK